MSAESRLKKYENDLKVIFDQWPKLYLGFGAEPDIQILKVIYDAGGKIALNCFAANSPALR